MEKDIESEYLIYLDKLNSNSVKESWVISNLPNLYNFIKDNFGSTISEKIYLLKNKKNFCKVCNSDVEFLSYKRGYRIYCSKKCSNSDIDLINSKLEIYKATCINKYGVDNASKSALVIDKIKESRKLIDYGSINIKSKETFLKKWGVDNPSKLEHVKKKKEKTNIDNWGVSNPFKSESIKDKIRKTNIEKYGYYHPVMSINVKNKIKNTNIERWGVDNYKSSQIDKEETLISKDPGYIKYISNSIYLLYCNKGHEYKIKYDNYYNRNKLNLTLCTICNPINELSSSMENDLYNFIESIYDGEIIKSYRDVLEIDIYLPNLNIGFEFNGLYWHSEEFKGKWYHAKKVDYFKERGIRVINIWEDDWTYKRSIIQSQITNLIGLTTNKIWARKCEVRQILDNNLSKDFLNENHVQGCDKSSIRIGLFQNNELISIMTFDNFEGRNKMENGGWNLSRFCNKIGYNVVGGASKLLSYFIKEIGPKRIISYADASWSNGDLYFKLGFNNIYNSDPDYKYVVGNKRIHKSRYRKSITGISESKLKLSKIWDCGKIKFEYKVLS
jgi:hypothetical protein